VESHRRNASWERAYVLRPAHPFIFGYVFKLRELPAYSAHRTRAVDHALIQRLRLAF
jgi:hypothetical protein